MNEPNQAKLTNPRFESLDGLRGVSALLVVLYHFQHFSAFDQSPYSWSANLHDLPLFSYLEIIYVYGWMSVDLFFVISGFIFAWLYEERVMKNNISAYYFFGLRLTRLYPLYIITTFAVIPLQWLYSQGTGQYFVMPFNDTYHLLLNTFFVQSWGFGDGPSYNGPTWSISIEALLYIIFFYFCRLKLSNSSLILLGVVVLGLIIEAFNPLIGRGISAYFSGMLAFRGFNYLSTHARVASIARIALITLATILTTIIIFSVYQFKSHHDYGPMFFSPFLWHKLSERFVMVFVFPLLVFSLAMGESFLNIHLRCLALLGNLSYSIYLWHFPLQLLIVTLVAVNVIPKFDLLSLQCLTSFFVILLVLSYVSYALFELPCQRLGRRLLEGRADIVSRNVNKHSVEPIERLLQEEQKNPH